MKVLEIILRTPGIYLNGEKNKYLNLEFQAIKTDGPEPDKDDSRWNSHLDGIEVLGIKEIPAGMAVKDDQPLGDSMAVPAQEGGSVKYLIRVEDGQKWYYRIVASGCSDCVAVWNRLDPSRVLSATESIVAKGVIQS